MFRLSLFRIRAFTAGNMAGLLSSVGRGGLMFMLIIWLQGIWLPLHGYNFEDHPSLGRHLYAALNSRVSHCGSHLGLSLGPIRRQAVCHGRYGARSYQLCPAHDASREFLVSGLCPDIVPQWRSRWTFCIAEHRRDYEQRPSGEPRRGLRHAGRFFECRLAAVDRCVFLFNDRGAQFHGTSGHVQRIDPKWRILFCRRRAGEAASGGIPLCGAPGLQSTGHVARPEGLELATS